MYKKKYTEAERKAYKAKRDDLNAKIREAIASGAIPTGYVSMKGHVYSAWNAWGLSLSGAPKGIYGTFKQWKDAGRMVRKGEHGHSIAFVSRDDDAGYTETDGEKTTTRATFKAYTVFEEGQTEIINQGLAFENAPPKRVTVTGALVVGATTEAVSVPF